MAATQSFKAPARRALVAVLLVASALLIAAAPANAKPSRPGASTSASTTLSRSTWYPANPCSFDATYTWAGFKGRDLSVSVRLLDQSGRAIAVPPVVSSVSGNGSFTFIFTFSGSGGTQGPVYARGALLAGGAEVSGSAATSPLVSSTCDGQISIGWVTTIPLS